MLADLTGMLIAHKPSYCHPYRAQLSRTHEGNLLNLSVIPLALLDYGRIPVLLVLPDRPGSVRCPCRCLLGYDPGHPALIVDLNGYLLHSIRGGDGGGG